MNKLLSEKIINLDFEELRNPMARLEDLATEARELEKIKILHTILVSSLGSGQAENIIRDYLKKVEK